MNYWSDHGRVRVLPVAASINIVAIVLGIIFLPFGPASLWVLGMPLILPPPPLSPMLTGKSANFKYILKRLVVEF